MHIDILTLFPEMFTGPFDHSIIKRARDRGCVEIQIHNIRDWTTDKHHVVDDYAFGGGRGMLLKPEPVFAAVEALRRPGQPVIVTTPAGDVFNQAMASEFASHEALLLLCGHYEGFDQRIHDYLADREVSIGDYVLTGGELAAVVVVDAVVRLLPGVLATGSADDESHTDGLLEYPQYTRPAVFRSWSVPEVLVSGDHARIHAWRRAQAMERTRTRRPDLSVPSTEGPTLP